MKTDYPKSNSPREAARAEIVEAVARAMCAAQLAWKAANGGDDASCIDMPDEDLALAAIEAHTRALREAGIVLAPLEPTEAMLSAYSGALKAHIEAVPEADRKWRKRRTFAGGPAGYKIPPDEKARCRYRAMIAARTEEPR